VSARAPRRGFTLLEMMVATALMSIAVVGLLSLLSSTVANAARIRQYDRAAMLARTKMNELLVLTPLPIGQRMEGAWDASWGWVAQVEPFERLPNAQPGSLQLARINLEVWWTAREERRSIQLDGYRRVPVPREDQP